jgi:hypothetical protein
MLDDRRLAPHIGGVVEDRIAQEKDMAHTQLSTGSHEVSAASGAIGSFGGASLMLFELWPGRVRSPRVGWG